MKQKYTEDQEKEMLSLYGSIPEEDLSAEAFEERQEIILDLADKYHKSTRMIIAKLAKMDIYVKKPVTSKVTGGKPETKESMVRRLEAKHKWPQNDFAGLEKAPKIVLQKLLGEYATE